MENTLTIDKQYDKIKNMELDLMERAKSGKFLEHDMNVMMDETTLYLNRTKSLNMFKPEHLIVLNENDRLRQLVAEQKKIIEKLQNINRNE